MTPPWQRWLVEPLDGKMHDRSMFESGAPELDRHLRQQGTQGVKRDVARVFIAAIGIRAEEASPVHGFYCLSATNVAREGLPPQQAKRLPHYPVPAALLGRLAVDEHFKGQGLEGMSRSMLK